jgi:CBS domain-containing protein
MIRLGNKPPLTVTPSNSVFEAARAMTERKVGAAAVLEDQKVVGIISERDVMQRLVAAGRDPETTTVREVMTSPVLAIGLKTTVAAAASLMRKHHIRHLIVLDDDDRLLGILALRYVLYEMMDDMERNVGDLMGFIMTDGPGG